MLPCRSAELWSWCFPAKSPLPIDPADHTLAPTTGTRLLSPGGARLGPGPDPLVENDDLVVTFRHPVTAVGFDLVLQALDCCSFVSITLLDANGEVIHHIDPVPTGQPDTATTGPAGPVFVGFTASRPSIATLVIDEQDDNHISPDANVGYDTFRYTTRPLPPA
ncbi:MAG TPA: hypothetical protein VFI47_02730 [Acidimicrobiales bacterium]|nr:hypothetical protein [Acidimicrobiales bacterium]